LKIFLAEHRGFCYGVERAVKMAETNAGEAKAGRAVTLGPIIHNPQVVDRLAECGIGVIDELEQADGGTVIIRSHGVGPTVYDQAAARGLTLVDATCPHVKKAQTAARSLREEGYAVVVVGERDHPEVKSIVAWAGEPVYVVESAAEAAGLPAMPHLGVVAQTTFPGARFEEIIAIFGGKTADLKVNRTICTATELRQAAAVDLASKVEVMVVVGGKNSANTARLAELCRQVGSRVYKIETAAELAGEWFAGVQAAGITAGASTPDWLIEEVYQKCRNSRRIKTRKSRKLRQVALLRAR
jgi:4-hydroxy-3-methylbut-2-enyl diphosphate reductase